MSIIEDALTKFESKEAPVETMFKIYVEVTIVTPAGCSISQVVIDHAIHVEAERTYKMLSAAGTYSNISRTIVKLY